MGDVTKNQVLISFDVKQSEALPLVDMEVSTVKSFSQHEQTTCIFSISQLVHSLVVGGLGMEGW